MQYTYRPCWSLGKSEKLSPTLRSYLSYLHYLQLKLLKLYTLALFKSMPLLKHTYLKYRSVYGNR